MSEFFLLPVEPYLQIPLKILRLVTINRLIKTIQKEFVTVGYARLLRKTRKYARDKVKLKQEEL